MSKIDEVLSFLLDGEWHTLIEIAQALQMDCQKLEKIVTFLADFDLILINIPNVRITFDTKKFLESLRECSEREESTTHEINSSVSL